MTQQHFGLVTLISIRRSDQKREGNKNPGITAPLAGLPDFDFRLGSQLPGEVRTQLLVLPLLQLGLQITLHFVETLLLGECVGV